MACGVTYDYVGAFDLGIREMHHTFGPRKSSSTMSIPWSEAQLMTTGMCIQHECL